MHLLRTYRMQEPHSHKEISFAETKTGERMVITIMADTHCAGLTLDRARWEELLDALQDFRWADDRQADSETTTKVEATALSLVRAAA